MDLYIIFVYTTVIAAILLTIYFTLKTPREQLSWSYMEKENRSNIEKKLQSYDQNAGAVIIRAQRKKAFIESLPIFILVLTVSLFQYHINNSNLCETTVGVSNLLLLFGSTFYGPPLVLFMFSLTLVKSGIKTLQTGYYPPLDSLLVKDTIATKTNLSKIRGIFHLLFPLFIIFLGIYAHNTFMNFTNHNIDAFIQKAYKKMCLDKNQPISLSLSPTVDSYSIRS